MSASQHLVEVIPAQDEESSKLALQQPAGMLMGARDASEVGGEGGGGLKFGRVSHVVLHAMDNTVSHDPTSHQRLVWHCVPCTSHLFTRSQQKPAPTLRTPFGSPLALQQPGW